MVPDQALQLEGVHGDATLSIYRGSTRVPSMHAQYAFAYRRASRADVFQEVRGRRVRVPAGAGSKVEFEWSPSTCMHSIASRLAASQSDQSRVWGRAPAAKPPTNSLAEFWIAIPQKKRSLLGCKVRFGDASSPAARSRRHVAVIYDEFREKSE